jgi:hypothetical protein
MKPVDLENMRVHFAAWAQEVVTRGPELRIGLLSPAPGESQVIQEAFASRPFWPEIVELRPSDWDVQCPTSMSFDLLVACNTLFYVPDVWFGMMHMLRAAPEIWVQDLIRATRMRNPDRELGDDGDAHRFYSSSASPDRCSPLCPPSAAVDLDVLLENGHLLDFCPYVSSPDGGLSFIARIRRA